MSVEEKQALTGLCKIEIKRWKAASESNPNMRYMVELMEVALTALTAQPVNLSSCRTLWYDHDDLSAEVKCIPVKDIKKAIRAAGYEVKE